ncbi:expressed unknown protein [Seminavis robusta]|uniref:Uncharacterized protein n=1 Tax=Seminavis robusta TaxID=568900 RepID=A0A9N8H8J8_9STRA|nr:expressed unknown protein [Seminavis robusta]|eukprot:Sro93_g048600.1 n/a (626) ;mRNA; r:82866-84743
MVKLSIVDLKGGVSAIAIVWATIVGLLVARKKESRSSLSWNLQQSFHRAATETTTTITTGSSSSRSDSKTAWNVNSERWLKGPRFRNSNDPLIVNDEEYLQKTILRIPHLLDNEEYLKDLLEQTLAIQGSQILDFSYQNLSTTTAAVSLEERRLWNIRLHYLAIHVHQHLPALPEARARQEQPQAFQQSVQQHQQHQIGTLLFDYECPGTNYLVANLLNYGIGADVFWSMVHFFKAGMAVNRVVHFVNKELPPHLTQHQAYRDGWQLASCPRGDYQCTFSPPSPCVPTLEDLENGYQLNATELQVLRKEGTLPAGLPRVVMVAADEWDPDWISLSPMKLKAEQQAQRVIANLMDNNYQAKDHDPTRDARIKLFRKVVGEGWRFGRAAGSLRTMLAAYMSYSLRPRPTVRQRIRSNVQESLPVGFDPHQTVGLPIRASDKCQDESECLTFQQHLEVVQAEWTKMRQNHTTNHAKAALPPAIIFSTESKEIKQEQEKYQQQQQQQPAVSFIVNQHDNPADTGFYLGNHGDEELLSALTTLQLQMHARLTIGNCCSNFARLMMHMMAGGFGAHPDGEFRCLQDVEDPRYRPCCWKSVVCLEKKANDTKVFLAEQRQKNNGPLLEISHG